MKSALVTLVRFEMPAMQARGSLALDREARIDTRQVEEARPMATCSRFSS